MQKAKHKSIKTLVVCLRQDKTRSIHGFRRSWKFTARVSLKWTLHSPQGRSPWKSYSFNGFGESGMDEAIRQRIQSKVLFIVSDILNRGAPKVRTIGVIQAVAAKTDVVEKLRSALRPSLDEYKVRKFNSDLDSNSVSRLFLHIPYLTVWWQFRRALFANSVSDGMVQKPLWCQDEGFVNSDLDRINMSVKSEYKP